MVKRNGIKDFIDRLGLTEEECRNLDKYYTEHGPFLTIEDMEGYYDEYGTDHLLGVEDLAELERYYFAGESLNLVNKSKGREVKDLVDYGEQQDASLSL